MAGLMAMPSPFNSSRASLDDLRITSNDTALTPGDRRVVSDGSCVTSKGGCATSNSAGVTLNGSCVASDSSCVDSNYCCFRVDYFDDTSQLLSVTRVPRRICPRSRAVRRLPLSFAFLFVVCRPLFRTVGALSGRGWRLFGCVRGLPPYVQRLPRCVRRLPRSIDGHSGCLWNVSKPRRGLPQCQEDFPNANT